MTPGATSRLIVAIDGPAGSGKSTLARRLAGALGLPYVNTGLMYRALTARALQRRLDVEDGSALRKLLQELRFDLDLKESPPTLLIDGSSPSDALVAPEVEASVSDVSRHPEVRSLMVDEQRHLGSAGAVMEGRDIGSVIFPDADAKLFLQAEPAERVSRRARERTDDGAVERELVERDRRDARVNPFVPAAGAVVIDTTGRTPDDVFEEAMSVIRDRTEHGDG